MKVITKTKRQLRRRALLPRKRVQPGTSPGVISVDPESPPSSIRVIRYNGVSIDEHALKHVSELRALCSDEHVLWVDVEGLGDAAVIHEIGQVFGLHSLSLEDVVHVPQRPKIETFDSYLFAVLRMAKASVLEQTDLDFEQVSLFIGRGFVVTFQQGKNGDCFDPVRERLRKGRVHIRNAGADYLGYALIDVIIDRYYPMLESYTEKLEDLEEHILADASHATANNIHLVRRDLLILRRALGPLREAIDRVIRDKELDFIAAETRLFLRDCHDHAVQLSELLETCRDLCQELLDAHNSNISLRTSEVMRVLTVITTIFIPLTFIAGIYGMNFDPASSPLNMPELRWYWGYPATLLLMALTTAGLLGYFARKGWL